MAFENLNYSTEKKIDELSIQDLIDAKKLEISQITKDKLKKLKVDILNSKSSLKVRDVEGNTIGKLKDNQVVDFNGDKKFIKYGNGKKLFLGVTLENGKAGYISADYVKGDILEEGIPETQIEEEIPEENTVEENSEEIEITEPDENNNKIPNTDNGNIDSTNQKEEKLKYSQSYIIEDGTIYLIGKDGEKIIQNKELSTEAKEVLKKYEKVAILSEILDIWKTQAQKTVEGLYWKDSRQDDEIILGQVDKIDDIFSSIFIDIQKGKDIDKKINKIWGYIKVAENEESIIGEDDMKRVMTTLNNRFLSKDQKLNIIYNQMRYGGLSGNSETIKEKVATHLLNSKEFSDVNEILNNTKLLKFIENNKNSELEKILGENLSDEILKTYSKIKSKQEKNRSIYAEKLESINTERKKQGLEEIKLDDFIKLNVNLSITNILKYALLERKIENSENRGNEGESYKGIYANMIGLGENKGFFSDNIFTISDNNIDTAIDISSTLALSIVSMGVGALAARGALAATTWGARGLGLANYSSKLGKAGSIAKFTSTAGIEGIAFYEGTTLTNNLIYGNNEWNHETGNGKEIFKSIAFMGVLRGVNKVMEAAGNAKMTNALAKTLNQKDTITTTEKVLARIGDLSTKVPPLMFKGTSITGVLAEAGLLTGTSVGLEVIFEGEGEWTWGEYLQAIVMVGMIKSVGKIKFRKENGNIKANVEKNVETDTKKKKGETETDTEKKAKTEKKTENEKNKTEEINLPENKSFYYESTNSKGVKGLYRVVTGKKGTITNLYNVNKKSTGKKIETYNQENAIAKELEIKGGAKTSWIKYNIENLRKDFGVKKVEGSNNNSRSEKSNSEKKEGENKKNENERHVNNGEEIEITSYEMKRFETIFRKELEGEKNITLKDNSGNEIIIIKEKNNKYSIEGSNELYSKKDLIDKIGSGYKLNYLENHLMEQLGKIKEGKEIKIKDSDGNTYKVYDNGDIHKLGKKETKLSQEEKSKLLRDKKIRENILKQNLENIDKINYINDFLKSKKLINDIDKKLSKLPFIVEKPYTFSKWLLYKNGVSNKIINTSWDSIKTPHTVYKNLFKENTNISEKVKSVLFADKDISYINGIFKVGGYALIPNLVEAGLSKNEVEFSEFITNYLSTMYLGIINTLILEYLFDDDWDFSEKTQN